MGNVNDKNFEDTVWGLFEQTGQIGYYNLFRAIASDDIKQNLDGKD